MYINPKIRIFPAGIYLLKVDNENFRTRYIIGSKLTTKKTLKPLQQHEDIKKNWHDSGVFIPLFIHELREVLLAKFTSNQSTGK